MAKVLIIWSRYELGGAERQLIRLADDWRQNGYQVEFLGMFEGSLRQELEARGYRTWLMAKMSRPTLIWRGFRKLKILEKYYQIVLRRKLATIKPDVVVSAMNFVNVMTGLTWWQVPGIRGQIWNQVDVGLGRMKKKLEDKAVAKATFLVSNSQIGARYLRAEYGQIPGVEAKIKIIPNIIKKMTNSKGSKWHYRRTDQEMIVTMVANLSEHKDHETLLRAWAEVMKKREGKDDLEQGKVREKRLFHICRLLLAGRDDEKLAKLKKLSKELGIKDSVEFLGAIDDVEALLAESDVGVLASQSEGSSNSVAEYMLAGLPVVVADIEANQELLEQKEIVKNPQNSSRGSSKKKLAQSADEKIGEDKKTLNYQYYYRHQLKSGARASDLALQIKRLLNDPSARQRVGANNRSRAQKIFSNSQNLATYRQLLAQILSQ